MIWPGDVRMPMEWNMVIDNHQDLETEHLRKIGQIPTTHMGDATKGDESDVESIGPYEFTRAHYPDSRHRHKLVRNMCIEPELGVDRTIAQLAKMQEDNECQNVCWTNTQVDKQIVLPRPRKGKERMEYTEEDIPALHQGWYDEFEDLLQGVPEEMPPFRDVNHKIPLIDPNKCYHYHLPCCLNSLKAEFSEKVEKYMRAGWWTLTSVNQATPMLCLPKKDQHLRTIVDCHQRNENTIKDVTPMPDQDSIREDVVWGKYRSKIDLSDAYEQVQIVSDDIWKTMFATIRGTYTSAVMQQGDCNAPATFQRLMTSIFQDVIGTFMHIYINDIFIFSDSIEEHQEHLRIVFD